MCHQGFWGGGGAHESDCATFVASRATALYPTWPRKKGVAVHVLRTWYSFQWIQWTCLVPHAPVSSSFLQLEMLSG